LSFEQIIVFPLLYSVYVSKMSGLLYCVRFAFDNVLFSLLESWSWVISLHVALLTLLSPFHFLPPLLFLSLFGSVFFLPRSSQDVLGKGNKKRIYGRRYLLSHVKLRENRIPCDSKVAYAA